MEQFTNLIEFRQAIYDHGLTKARNAQFELLGALLLGQPIRSFPELSLLPVFRRGWSSAYAAIEDGEQDREWLEDHFTQRIPRTGPVLFSLDARLGLTQQRGRWPICSMSTAPREQLMADRSSSVTRTRCWPGFLNVVAVGLRRFRSDERPVSSQTWRSA